MASAGLRIVAALSTASLPQHALLANCRAPVSLSLPMMVSGRGTQLRRSSSPPLRSAWTKTKEQSDRCGNGVSVHAAVALLDASADEAVKKETSKATDVEILACPICYRPLSRTGLPGLTQQAISRSQFQCNTCKKSYSSTDVYLDLTVTANAKVYTERLSYGIELFRSSFVSFAYERGWRQLFQIGGFPGPDEEVKIAQDYFQPTYGDVILDVSCGSGLFTRRFANLGVYSAVIAIDFSENMLRQTFDYVKQDASLQDKSIALVRADVARMPFATGSIASVFAGAALHCWPSPAIAMAEISRILQPGGVFVASTFVDEFGIQILSDIRLAITQNTVPSLRQWLERELEDLMRISGLINYRSFKRGAFIMLTAQKPK